MRLIPERPSDDDLVAIWMLAASLLITTFWLGFITWVIPQLQQ